MKKMFFSSTKLITTLISLLSFFTNQCIEKGIVIVPVADLAGEPMQTYYPHQAASTSYQQLPWACYKKDYAACPRVHQLLYHEIVDIMDKKGEEMQIRIPHVFYQTMANDRPQQCYWTLKKNIIPLKKLQKKNIDQTKIPLPIHFDINNEQRYCNNVSLIEPFTEPTMHITFSAGTRFIKADEQPNENVVMVYCLHPKFHTIQTIAIPKSIAYIFHPKTIHNRIADFIAILRRWAHHNNGIIPYLWGGCSFTDRHTQQKFILKKERIREKMLGYYLRPYHTALPKTGYDCSSLIVRAAQIVGLPYYYKNTYTIIQQLPLLARHERLKEGDLIWISSGHILIVANREQQTIIEASSYDSGYGKIHEVPISNVFKGIKTFDDLQECYKQKKLIYRLDAKGTVFDINDLKLIKFASIWT